MQGRMMIYSGRVPEGLALLDEAMVGLAAGEVSPIIAGMAYCSLIEACQELSTSRAASWTSALTRWCDTQPGLVPYTGQCALHRGQIMRLRGAYDEALAEFVRAQRRYEKEVRRHRPGWRWLSRATCCESAGSWMRRRRPPAGRRVRLRAAAGIGVVVARSRSYDGSQFGDPSAARRSEGAGATLSAAPGCRRDPGCGTSS